MRQHVTLKPIKVIKSAVITDIVIVMDFVLYTM